MTPVFGHGHLRLYLLSLLAEAPRHGYELIQALGERFGGTYVPSAGTIYPRLAKLEEEGLVTKSSDGRKTVYSITDEGRRELRDREGELNGIEDEVTDSVRRLADDVRSSVNAAMKTLRADLASAAREARQDARSATRASEPSPGPTETRLDGRRQLEEVEAVLQRFRHDIRSELRSRAARDQLGVETVALLRSSLDEVSRRIAASFENSAS